MRTRSILLSACLLLRPLAAVEPVQIVMEEVVLKGTRFKLEKGDLLEPLADMYRKAGFAVVPAAGDPPAEALQIRFTVGAIHDGDGRVAYQVIARLSSGKDAKLKENPAGQPQRIWFANITAARSRFEDGVAELQATLANIATLLYRQAAKARGTGGENVAFPFTFPAPPQSTRINAAEVQNHSPLKIKSPGFCPPWPRAARERRIYGTVVVDMIVGEDGRPLRAWIRQGPAEFHLHALQWALGYEFEPALVNDKPIKAKFSFNLSYNESPTDQFSIK